MENNSNQAHPCLNDWLQQGHEAITHCPCATELLAQERLPEIELHREPPLGRKSQNIQAHIKPSTMKMNQKKPLILCLFFRSSRLALYDSKQSTVTAKQVTFNSQTNHYDLQSTNHVTSQNSSYFHLPF